MSEALKEARDFRDTSDIEEVTDIEEGTGHLEYDEWLKQVKGIKKGAYGINSDEHAKYSGEWRDYITKLFNNLPSAATNKSEVMVSPLLRLRVTPSSVMRNSFAIVSVRQSTLFSLLIAL